jgi:hypothetical protein
MTSLKIYIQNIQNNISNKLELLHKYLVKENEFTQLYSKTGIYIIQNNQCFLLQNTNKKYEIKKHICHNREYELLLDYSKENLEKIYSQLPTQYILNKITKMEYKLSAKSPLTLIVNGSYEKIKNVNNNIFLKQEKKQILDQETHFIAMNCYFECLEKDVDLDNPFFIDEFNVFLSLLN